MQNSQNKKKLQVVLLVLIAVLTLGIGYASITAINLIINGNGTASAVQENFQVYFTNSSITEGKGTVSIDEDDATIGYFDITGLSKVGDYAEATYTVLNNSNGVGADISLQLTNSNNEYFKVTETVADSQLQAGDTTTAIVKVEMIKTPIQDAVTTSVTAKLIASPIDNATATGSDPVEVIKPTPDPYVYTINGVSDIYLNTDISSWTRKYNNFAAAKQEFGHPAAIAHDTENGVVSASYVAFERNGTVYYLKGRIDETSLQDKPVYEANVAELKRAFPDWEMTCNTENASYFDCSSDGFYANAGAFGSVFASGSGWDCGVSYAGNASCSS